MRIRTSLYLLVFLIILIPSGAYLAEAQSSFNDQQKCSLRIIQDSQSITPRIENKVSIYKLKASEFRIETDSDSCSPGIYVLSSRSQIDYLTQTPLIFAAGGYGLATNYDDVDILADVPAPVSFSISLEELIKIATRDVLWAKQRYEDFSMMLGYKPTPVKAYAVYAPFIDPATRNHRNYAVFKKFNDRSSPMSKASGKVIYAVVYTRSDTATKLGAKSPTFYLFKPHIIALNFTDSDNIKDIEETASAGADIPDKNVQLLEAAQNGNVNYVRSALNHGADVNARNTKGLTALMMASERGNVEVVKLLLDKGADVNAKGNNGSNALIMASAKGSAEVVKLLLDKGADVNAKSATKDLEYTALMSALMINNIDIVRLLLDRGADINMKLKTKGQEYTPLMMASFLNRIDTVRLLLDRGADVNAKGIMGTTALIIASMKGNAAVAKLLLANGADVNAKVQINDSEATVLIMACMGGSTEVIRLLLDNGVDVNAASMQGCTALMMASGRGHLEIVRFLLDRGAGINMKDSNDETALIAASSAGHSEIVKLLLDKGADFNIKNINGATALSKAKIKGAADVVRILENAGARN
jgi:FOG: Ankyrin repeat